MNNMSFMPSPFTTKVFKATPSLVPLPAVVESKEIDDLINDGMTAIPKNGYIDGRNLVNGTRLKAQRQKPDHLNNMLNKGITKITLQSMPEFAGMPLNDLFVKNGQLGINHV